MPYRTRTYIAADWTNDYDAVERLHKWNDSEYWSLSFSDAHDLKQAYDSSLNCTIKKSLKSRLDASKTFVLIVGENTAQLTAGGCRYCDRYSGYWHTCSSGYTVDHRSYIEFECEKAIEAGIKIVVLYKSRFVDRTKCPLCLKNVGQHVPMYCTRNGNLYWNYSAVNMALNG